MAARDREHYVYRLFDKDDRLLYIGCTEAVEQRVYMHLATYTMACAWDIHRNYDHHTSEAFPSLEAARAAERAAILSEMPLLNRQHNPKRWKRHLGSYVPVGDTAQALEEMAEANAPSPEDRAMARRILGLSAATP